MDKIIEEINQKFGIHFEKKGDGKYTYSLSKENRIKIDLIKETVDVTKWYGGYNKNGLWDKQPRNESGLIGLIHNLISINCENKENWTPPF